MKDLRSYTESYLADYRAGGFETVLVGIRAQHALSFLERHASRNVLEIGCGLESLAARCTDCDSFTVVEPSETFVNRAIEMNRDNPRVRILPGYFDEQMAHQLEHDGFDAIILSSLLHEVPNPAEILRLTRTLCRSSGTGEPTTVHVNVPNAYSFHRLLAVEMGLISDVFESSEREITFGQYRRFSKETLLQLTDECGFEAISSGTYFLKPFTHTQMEAILESAIPDRRLLQGLEGMVKYMPDLGCEIFAELKAKE